MEFYSTPMVLVMISIPMLTLPVMVVPPIPPVGMKVVVVYPVISYRHAKNIIGWYDKDICRNIIHPKCYPGSVVYGRPEPIAPVEAEPVAPVEIETHRVRHQIDLR